MNTRRLVAVLLTLSAASVFAGQPEQKKSAKGMTYSIRMPDGYVKGQHPLLVGLHGSGDNCQNFVKWLLAHEASLPKGAILLVPQALADGAWDKADLEPLTELIRETQADCLPTRTIGMGFSRGAFYVLHVAFTSPELLQGAIPCSGGLPDPVPDSDALRKIPIYLIHGELDTKETGVPFEASVKASEAFEAKKCLCKFEKIAGMKHTVDWDAVKRGMDWIGGILDERDKAAADAIGAQIGALEATLKAKSWEAAAKGFADVTFVPRAFAAKFAGLAKTCVGSTDEPLAAAAIEACGRCGAEGVPVLKGVPVSNLKLASAAATALGATGSPAAVEPLLAFLKASKEGVSIAAAGSLGKLGGDAAARALVSGLVTTEGGATQDGRKAAMLEALKKITGQAFAKSSEWKKWLAEHPGESNK